MGVKVITDSTSYISEDLRKQYDISIVSLSVIFEKEVFKEIEIDNTTFYNKLHRSPTIPTSSQPSLEEVYGVFERYIKDGIDIVGVFISSEMSGTYSTAGLVKNMILEKYPDASIEIIDSRSNCMQLGFAALQGAKAAKEGKNIEEVKRIIEGNIKRSRFLFIPDTLEYLKKGGRIGGASALLGTILQIKPILTVINGKTEVLSKVRTKKKAIQAIMDKFKEDIEQCILGEIVVHHINNEEEALCIARDLEKIIGTQINICSIGPVIGTHVGPGALGIAYYTERELVD